MGFFDRMVRAAKLDPSLYQEVKADGSALKQAALVVILSLVATLIGSGRWGVVALLGGMITSLFGWCLWTALVYFIGTRVLPGPSTNVTYPELLRTLGFAYSPSLLQVCGIIPGLSMVVPIVTGIWALAASVIAVREGLAYDSTARAIGVCVISAFILIGVAVLAAFVPFGMRFFRSFFPL